MVDGVLYFSVPNHAYAVDARTGQSVWHYYWKSDRSAIGNRGVGMHGDWLYFETPDNHVVSLDAATGAERWHKQIASVRQQYFSTPAPVVIRNHVIVGMGGDALDVPALAGVARSGDRRDPVEVVHDAEEAASPASRRGPTNRRRPTAAACRGSRPPTIRS